MLAPVCQVLVPETLQALAVLNAPGAGSGFGSWLGELRPAELDHEGHIVNLAHEPLVVQESRSAPR
eukprot:5477202-Alexandrium_andersonii.AAC.1